MCFFFQDDEEERKKSVVSPLLLEVERNLALLLGLHSFCLLRGQPLSTHEMNAASFLRSDIMVGGLLPSHGLQKIQKVPGGDLNAWYRSQIASTDGLDAHHLFAYKLAGGIGGGSSRALMFKKAAQRSAQSCVCLELIATVLMLVLCSTRLKSPNSQIHYSTIHKGSSNNSFLLQNQNSPPQVQSISTVLHSAPLKMSCFSFQNEQNIPPSNVAF